MGELFKGILAAPVATLFVIAGMVFLLVAVVGNVVGKIEPGDKGRVAAGVLGLVFVVIGLSMHLGQKSPQASMARDAEPPTRPQARAPSGAAPAESPVTEESEPNDHISAANPLAEGATVRGSISTKQDRDFYKFTATNRQTRVILRKMPPGFGATVEIYDGVENLVGRETTGGDQPVTLAFKSDVGSPYHVLVKSVSYSYTGDYELTIRKE